MITFAANAVKYFTSNARSWWFIHKKLDEQSAYPALNYIRAPLFKE